MTQPKIALIYTGGTIGMIKNPKTGALSNFNFTELLDKIPELELLDCSIETLSLPQPIDSSDMSVEAWIQTAELIEYQYNKFDGFVVLHGSDTMAYSASALSFMFENLSKPIIFTGSQLPIGDLRTDAKENLITAIQIASLQKNKLPLINEVCLYFEYKLYRANRTTKISAEHFEAFASPNFPPLAESGVFLKVDEHLLLPKPSKPLQVHKKFDKNILILKIFPSISATFINQILSVENLKGVVLETFGSGNAPTDVAFINALKTAIDKGIFIVNVTQCSGGSVQMGRYETSTQLKNIGVISGKDITTEAAISKLMYLIGQNISVNIFKTVFETPLRGEMA